VPELLDITLRSILDSLTIHIICVAFREVAAKSKKDRLYGHSR